MNTLPEPVQVMLGVYTRNIIVNYVVPRKTSLGMWKYTRGKHEITVNNNLQGVQFMVTLVHEIAHACTWDTYKNTVKPHGPEWKDQYRQLMLPLMQGYFDLNTDQALEDYMKNPPASSVRSLNIKRISNPTQKMVEDIAVGETFTVTDGRKFTKLRKRKVKWECSDPTGKMWILGPGVCVF